MIEMHGVYLKTHLMNLFAWLIRYAHLCRHILDDCCVNLERFAHDFLPSLITLGNDPIPNVRISLAKSLAENVIHIGKGQVNQLTGVIKKLSGLNVSRLLQAETITI